MRTSRRHGAGANDADNIGIQVRPRTGKTNTANQDDRGKQLLPTTGKHLRGRTFGSTCSAKLTVTGDGTLSGTATLGESVADGPHISWGSHAAISLASSGIPTSLQGGFPGTLYSVQGGSNWGVAIARATNDASGPHLTFYKTRSGDASVKTAVGSSDALGNINFQGATDASTVEYTAAIKAITQGAISAGNIPTGLYFYTGLTNTQIERLRIDATGVSVFTSAISSGTAGSVATSITRTGTFDTTGSTLSSTGASISVTSTRSAGANNLNNRALQLTASGANRRSSYCISRLPQLNCGNTCIMREGNGDVRRFAHAHRRRNDLDAGRPVLNRNCRRYDSSKPGQHRNG